MAVRIRLRRMGAKGRPFYRLVVVDSRMPRDGKYIEAVGYYNPHPDPPEVKVDEERVLYWLERGAQPTDTARNLLKKSGIIERWEERRRGVISLTGQMEGPSPEVAELKEEMRKQGPVSGTAAETTDEGQDEREIAGEKVPGEKSSQGVEPKSGVEL